MPTVRPGCTQQSFKFNARYHIGKNAVAKLRPETGVKHLIARGQDDGSNLDFLDLLLVAIVYRFG